MTFRVKAAILIVAAAMSMAQLYLSLRLLAWLMTGVA